MNKVGSSQETIKQNPQAALNRALGFLRSGQLPDALALCRNIVKTVPGYVEAWLLLCQLQLDIQRPDRAMDCVDRALVINPRNPQAVLLRAECLIASSRTVEARSVLESLESQLQRDALMLRLIGNVYAGILSYDDASRCFQRSVKLDAGDVECWHLYSGVLFARGLLDEAEQALSEVLRLNPNHSEALLTRSSMRKQRVEDNHVNELQEFVLREQQSQQKKFQNDHPTQL